MNDITILFYCGLLYMAYALLKVAIHVFGGPVRRNYRTGTLEWGNRSVARHRRF
jgi:hypothetical protein